MVRRTPGVDFVSAVVIAAAFRTPIRVLKASQPVATWETRTEHDQAQDKGWGRREVSRVAYPRASCARKNLPEMNEGVLAEDTFALSADMLHVSR